MFKNIFKFFLIFLLIFVVASCDQTNPDDNPGNNTGTEDNYTYVTPETDKLKLTADWEGKDFITDGS